jgi:transaldolase
MRNAKLVGMIATSESFNEYKRFKESRSKSRAVLTNEVKTTIKTKMVVPKASKSKSQPKKKREAKAKAKATLVSKATKESKLTKLAQLKNMTTVVIDTGDFNLIQQFKPTDATTNPSLILAACNKPEYDSLIKEAISSEVGSTKTAKKNKSSVDEADLLTNICDKLAVSFGTKILEIIPGYVSTEVDARLSFDTEATIKKAKKIIAMYKKAGVSKDRILIKIAATWEGIQAAKQLQKEGIQCNLTLLFSFHQALACAQAGCTLISPFVGRILDWYKKSTGIDYKPEDEPGVHSVTRIYNYFKKYGHKTYVMGASFRNSGEILNLAGCDRLTISPALLDELSNSTDKVVKKLDASKSKSVCNDPKLIVTEKVFRWELNKDAMATEKLAEGIRKFGEDLETLEGIIKTKLADLLKDSSAKNKSK